MRYLAIIRHGEFTQGESKLNAEGRKQMGRLALLLYELNPIFYSSVGPRSIESAELLASHFKKVPQPFEFFGSNARFGEYVFYPEAFRFINEITESVVVVSKGEWANEFITFFYEKKFGTKPAIVPLERGTGVLINCENGDLIELF
jgi:phosphohistidine phosphatase SixA